MGSSQSTHRIVGLVMKRITLRLLVIGRSPINIGREVPLFIPLHCFDTTFTEQTVV